MFRLASTSIRFLSYERKTLFRNILVIVLLAASTTYLIRGALIWKEHGGDFGMRWGEQQYVHRGKNPFDVWETWNAQQHGVEPPRTGRNAAIEPDLGRMVAAYPPWAYFTGAVLLWPKSYAAAKWYWSAINILCMIGILFWAYRLGCKHSRGTGLLFAASVLAIRSTYITVGNGQYGIVTIAFLVLALVLSERQRPICSGLAAGASMSKVTLSGPFVLAFLFTRRWLTLSVASAYVLLGTVAVCLWTNTGPVEMFQQMLRVAPANTGASSSQNINLWLVLEALGMDGDAALKLGALIAVLVGLCLLYICRESSLLVNFAIVAYVSRMWTYHSDYDDMILLFLLLAVGVSAIQRTSRACWVSFLLMGMSLWTVTPRAMGPTWTKAFWTFQSVVWLASLLVLIVVEIRSSKPRLNASGAHNEAAASGGLLDQQSQS
jgi:hypothetical protein